MAAGLRARTLALSATAASPEKARPRPEAECSATWKPAALTLHANSIETVSREQCLIFILDPLGYGYYVF
ncbi:protein of unknown function [Vibrio tapetis subsp. tapetis]|uniref:Uncharacterized protein n=1 Tax=Vibrio tapetis subsp. tapetis TaxID=1671868 RepID=A0A2N8ZN03_9VIBR|nr:protein of unknown function [Vibrio tapetis subsp. tapetis]